MQTPEEILTKHVKGYSDLTIVQRISIETILEVEMEKTQTLLDEVNRLNAEIGNLLNKLSLHTYPH